MNLVSAQGGGRRRCAWSLGSSCKVDLLAPCCDIVDPATFSDFMMTMMNMIIMVENGRSWGTTGPTVPASAGPPTLAGSHSMRYFVAKSVLLRFTRFLGVQFSGMG